MQLSAPSNVDANHNVNNNNKKTTNVDIHAIYKLAVKSPFRAKQRWKDREKTEKVRD